MIDKAAQSKILRKNVIVGHRKRKNLCINCGKNTHEGKCISDYSKVDTRTDNSSLTKSIDFLRKIKTIMSYRKRKNLCQNCGKEIHNGECENNFDKSDNRSEEEKLLRPATVLTPKSEKTSILETLRNHKHESNLKVEGPQTDIKLQRDFIVIDVNKSSKGNRIEFSCMQYLSRKFKDHIICVLGDIEKVFPYSEVLKIRKFTNIHELKNIKEQDIINHLHSGKYFLSYPSQYTSYCILKNIPVYTFSEDKNVNSVLKNLNYKF